MSTVNSTPHEGTPVFFKGAKSIQGPMKSAQAMKKKKMRYGTIAAVLSFLALTAMTGYQYSSINGINGGDIGSIQDTTSLVSTEKKSGLPLDLVNTNPCEATCKEHYVHQNYRCSDTKKTLVCYPTSGYGFVKHLNYPVVLFQRGSSGWDGNSAGYESWMQTMAEQCLIVLAPMTSGANSSKKSCQTNDDLITVFNDAKDNWKAKGAWNIQVVTPDWTRIGAAGHSAGAHHLPTFQMHFGKRINAVVFSHGGSTDDSTSSNYKKDLDLCLSTKDKKDNKSICAGVPTFFLTSPKDTKVKPEWTKNWYTKVTTVAQHVVYVEADSSYGHMEPVTKRINSNGYGILNTYTARFLACHLWSNDKKRSEEACAYIYGKSPSKAICSYKSVVKGTCKVSQP